MKLFLALLVPRLIFASIIDIEVDEEEIEFEVDKKYEPTWESLDSRPLPEWYDDAKFGIMITFGVFSVPSFGSAWFPVYLANGSTEYVEFMKKNYRPDFTYADFAKDLTMEFFNATQWADLFKRAGARYAVLIAKHGEGFPLWPSKYSFNWNSVDVGPKRDVVNDYVEATKKAGLHVGLYHCLYEWLNPLLREDAGPNNFTTRNFPKLKSIPELIELVENYKPELIWSDCSGWGPGEFPWWNSPAPDNFWGSREFLAWLYNESPVKDTVVVNDRWEFGTGGTHGGYYNYHDKWMPNKTLPTHKWESVQVTHNSAWTYIRDATLKDYRSYETLLEILVQTIAYGGNLLLNVGPTKEGTIPVIQEERLTQLGEWLQVNGEAIYGSKPWTIQEDKKTAGVYFTAHKRSNDVYAIFLNWPESGVLELHGPNPTAACRVALLGGPSSLSWSKSSDGIKVELPNLSQMQHVKGAWVVKFDALSPDLM